MHCIIQQTTVSLCSISQKQFRRKGIPTVEKLPKSFTMEDEEYASKDECVRF
jgi:hypothetical protein